MDKTTVIVEKTDGFLHEEHMDTLILYSNDRVFTHNSLVQSPGGG